MNKIQLFKIIRKNQRIAQKRHPLFEKNTAIKVASYLIATFWAIYLFILGILSTYWLKDSSIEAYDYINGLFFIFLIVDFFLRFTIQHTPAQEIKPYKLLPISIKFLINTFLIRIGLSKYNLFWLFFFIPFGIITIWMKPYYSFSNFIGYQIGIWLMFIINSYWYLFWRTLIHHHIIYLIIPCCIYTMIVILGCSGNEYSMNAFMYFMDGFIQLNPLCFIGAIITILILFLINIPFQYRFIYQEISKVEKTTPIHSIDIPFLNHFGKIGEYLKLEIKSTIRNRIARKQFLSGTICMILLCSIFSFTDLYDSKFMNTFICVYCFACHGIITQTNIMCIEGNYLDGLMSRKESVLSLLKAKYIFSSTMLIFPILIMLTPIIKEKVSVIQILGCLFFTTGVIFPFIFQLAVYNNHCIPLNNRLTKSGLNTKSQMIVSMIALFVPMGFMFTLVTILDRNIAGIIMCSMGLLGTLLSPIWLKNIYKRFMNRRYENMANFRKTK